MCKALEHRGPDSRGIHTDAGVGLGIQRLRIIDLATGDQPIYNEDGTVVVVLNGEIYNFRELRRDLEKRGHRFCTSGDTEPIVHLYEEYGVRCVEHLHGMFAFALWDTKRRRLLVARDRVGKKPLFYSHRGRSLSFASELGALMQDEEIPRDVDYAALDAYLAFRYIPSPLSAFKAVRKLPPAHRMVFEDERLTVEPYWDLSFTPKRTESDDELLEELRTRLRAATQRRLVADVPLGAFLSGGVDSAAVVAAMAEASTQPVKTFSIGFSDPRLDERALARIVAQRFETDHHELVVEPDAVEVLPRIIRHYGEPFADATAIPTFYLAEMARRHVTVALNGDGGDEAFGGYTRYVANAAAERVERLPWPLRAAVSSAGRHIPSSGKVDSTRSRLRRMASTIALDPMARYTAYMTTLQGLSRESLYTDQFRDLVGASQIDEIIGSPWRESDADQLVDRMLDVDTKTYLADDLLTKVDIATMAVSLEGRSPMLDHEFLEFAAGLPVHLKVAGREKKVGLRRALRGWVPDEILDAPKKGFQPPLALWFRTDLKSFAREILLDRVSLDRGYFREAELRRLLGEHDTGLADHSQGLWTLLVFELWHREYVDGATLAGGLESAVTAP
jgi:asparagine synthase (glutamine-hydrolysing)